MHREGLPPVRGCNAPGTVGSSPQRSSRCEQCSPVAPSPMASYLQLRSQTKLLAKSLKLQEKHHAIERLEPLNAVAGNTHERGSTGGFFNSSTHLRALPLSSSIHRSPVVHRGTRVMMLHGDRFLPRMRTVSDSALRISMPSTQNQRLSACEQRVAQSRFVKDLLCDPPHRLNFGYYMQGQTLPLSNVVGLSDKERERLQLATARNNDLYYGKGIRLTQQPIKLQHVEHFPSSSKTYASGDEEDILSDAGKPSTTFITQK